MSFIKLDRKLLEWEWKDKPEMVALWIEILLQANFYDNVWHGEIYESGSFPTSIAKLSKGSGLSERTVRTCLNRLKSTNELTIKATKQGTKIIVNKWALYQGMTDESDKRNDKQTDFQSTNDRQTTDTTIRKKESKKEKNSLYIGKSDDFIRAFKDFSEMRTKKKKPMTDRAKELIIKDLERLSKNELTQIAILEKSTKEGWSGVYALKEQKDSLPVYDPKNNISMTADEEEELLKLMGKGTNVS